MITPMKKITVYGIEEDRKAVIETLQRSGKVEFSQSDSENEAAGHVDVNERIMQFERYIAASAQAISILDEYAPEKTGMFSVRKDISMQKYSMRSDEISNVGNVAMDIIQLKKSLQDNLLKIGRENAKAASIEAWTTLDVPMNTHGSANTNAMLMSVPFELTCETADALLEECREFLYYEILSAARDLSCVFVVYLKDAEETVTKVLREKGFVQPGIGLSHRTPLKKIENLKEKVAAIEAENQEIIEKIAAYAQDRDAIKLFYDHLVLRKEKYLSLSKVLVTEDAFVIEGSIAERDCKKIKAALEKKALCSVEFSEFAKDEEAPVLLTNNAFVKPVENITKDYSMPSKTDIDPDAIMSIFYYLFFGMMFSDAGYGLLLALAAGYVGFVAKVESGTKQFMRMFFYCGLSTLFWGLMYGSFFGDVLPGLKPLWIDPVKEPLLLLIFSICLGLIQVVIGLILKFYIDFRAGEKMAAICDTGSWILVLLGAAMYAGGTVLKAAMLSNVGIVLAGIGVIIIILMRGRDKKNLFSRLIGGIIGLYDITSYVSDLLSYSRLMALGLATGVIAQVVNIMGHLAGGGVIGTIGFAVIFVAGHLLNFAINVLGAYVHTNRLQYVEFYSKFYEGGGREFAPLGMNTKYYKFMEDDDQ